MISHVWGLGQGALPHEYLLTCPLEFNDFDYVSMYALICILKGPKKIGLRTLKKSECIMVFFRGLPAAAAGVQCPI